MTTARVAGFALAAVLALAGCGKKQAGGWGEMVVSVVAATAKAQAVEETIEAVGTLAARDRVEIKSEVDGTIDAIAFKEGQAVAAGDILVALDQAKLKATLAEAQANLKLAEATRERYAALLKTQAVSRQEADQAEATWAARQALADRLASELDDATITAPFDGIAGACPFSPGQYIPRGTMVTTLVDSDPMRFEFHLPERFLGQVKPGQAVKLRTAAFGEEEFSGEVYFLDPQVDPSTRTVLVKATVPNGDGRLRHGMFASSRLVVEVRTRAVVVPESAVLHQGDLTFVYAIDGEQKVQMRPVKLGVHLASAVEVLEGLQPGEQVVAEGHQKLFPGAKVAPKDAEENDAKAAADVPA